jgi:hypothetical protein
LEVENMAKRTRPSINGDGFRTSQIHIEKVSKKKTERLVDKLSNMETVVSKVETKKYVKKVFTKTVRPRKLVQLSDIITIVGILVTLGSIIWSCRNSITKLW